MPTPGERIALLEQRVDQMWEWINGGPSTKYEDSARGRLHELMTQHHTSELLAAALDEVKRERGRRWATWQKALALIIALASLFSPYVLFFLAH